LATLLQPAIDHLLDARHHLLIFAAEEPVDFRGDDIRDVQKADCISKTVAARLNSGGVSPRALAIPSASHPVFKAVKRIDSRAEEKAAMIRPGAIVLEMSGMHEALCLNGLV